MIAGSKRFILQAESQIVPRIIDVACGWSVTRIHIRCGNGRITGLNSPRARLTIVESGFNNLGDRPFDRAKNSDVPRDSDRPILNTYLASVSIGRLGIVDTATRYEASRS